MNAKRVLAWTGLVVGLVVASAVIFIAFQLMAFNRGTRRVYNVPPVPVSASADSAVIARGRHLSRSIGGCEDCHGDGLQGGLVEDLGPIGVINAPNLTTGRGGVGDRYSDGTFARSVRHGVKSDGTTVLFMPSADFNWWPDEDLAAIVSYWRSLPPVDHEVPPVRIGLMGKLLDQFGVIPLTIASEIDHNSRPNAPEPAPTAAYGSFLALGCVGCHGQHLSGGKIPGAPADLPIPTNLTRHETGLAGWTEEDFVHLLDTGERPDGSQVDPFMATASTRNLNSVEKAALWAYLQSLEPREFGNR